MIYPKILAIDYGTTRVGLAISRGTLAEPLQILASNESLLPNLVAVIQSEKVEKIIVGLSENLMAEKTRAFVEQLRQHTDIPIDFVDETLSSHTVHQKMLKSGAKKSHRAANIDHLAAAEFLQEYLDEKGAN